MGAGKGRRNVWLAVIAAAIVAVNGWLVWKELFRSSESSAEPDWEVRNAYRVNGDLKWIVFPGGEMKAGRPAGAMWMIHRPFGELEGRHLRIAATHRQTGLTLEELPETTIDENSALAYDHRLSSQSDDVDKTQVVTRMAVPLGGLWRFELFLDGESFGDAVLNVPDGGWEPSPTFRSGVYEMTGTEGKLGIINPGFVAGKRNKYMWHFWGSDEELTGASEIYGVKEGSLRFEKVYTGYVRPGPLNGADAAFPSGMSLPEAGRWKLVATIDGRWFENLVVDVREP